eukprot:TRINITY_DN78960_c0_g1_i1.p1 TRINITY_DN78960_c0_g1~~TRINITY_DN78960_c0_g1_i1.p1  ORF type:complete len:461 (-),score=111.51 TRINITY_DN78960_c0_g1_i1:50-1246(-)
MAEHRVAGHEPIRVGSLCHLKSVSLEAVIVLKVWASFESGPAMSARRRACGEVHIPLDYIYSHCDGCLYHTWLNLESAGLNDSVASLGYSRAETADAFKQAMTSGPRQLFQPKVCISLCKAPDLGQDGQDDGQILWTADLRRTQRIERWGPLLKSQQQHAVMCAAQHLQGLQGRSGQDAPQRLIHLKAQSEEQQREIESLEEQLQRNSQNDRGSQSSSVPTSAAALEALLGGSRGGIGFRESVTILEERTRKQIEEARVQALNMTTGAARRGREAEAQQELERLQAQLQELRGELQNSQGELSKIGDEANNKIEAANFRIRALRRERDEALASMQERRDANEMLRLALEDMEQEKEQLNEQKEALIRIVEELHQTCSKAGLPSGDRASIDSLTGFKKP